MQDLPYINKESVARLLPMHECIPLMEQMFKALGEGKCLQPLRSLMWLPDKNGILGMMPGYVEELGVMGIKVITVFHKNQTKGIPSHQGVVMLFDAKNGQPLLSADASEITSIRTAAASAVATRYLARENAFSLAIIGSGEQARRHIEAMLLVRDIKMIYIWSRQRENANALRKETENKYNIEVIVSLSARDAVTDTDIICTVTSSPEPVVFGEWLRNGVHINAVGSSIARTRELDSKAIRMSGLFTDCYESLFNEAGDFLIPRQEGVISNKHVRGEIGEVILKKKQGRKDADEITLFKSLGIAAEDIFSAWHIYKKKTGAIPIKMNNVSQLPISVSLQDIREASVRLKGKVFRTPLIRFYPDGSDKEIYLKLENLQPISSFKIRGACNAMSLADPTLLATGVYTASAGNMAQGVAWNARILKIPCTVVVPDHAPQTKLDAITRLGAKYIKIPFNDWWQVLVTRKYEGIKGVFIHPVADPNVIAANGTIGLEILEDCPDLDAVIVPYGGGGLISGIATALKSVRPDIKVYAAEVETAAPLSASLKAGQPMKINYTPSFVDGMGSASLLTEMWPLVSALVDDSIVLSLAQIAAALRLLIERSRIIAEGAGASPLAAALTGSSKAKKIVCVISGGNIDGGKISKILSGEIP